MQNLEIFCRVLHALAICRSSAQGQATLVLKQSRHVEQRRGLDKWRSLFSVPRQIHKVI